VAQQKLAWQSKLVLLAVVPFVGTGAALGLLGWPVQSAPVIIWTAGLSALLGLVTWKLRAATPAAALTGAAITASLMFSTIPFPYEPWHTGLIPILAVSVLAFAATRVGRRKKEWVGMAEGRRGRSASQVAANLGMAALVLCAPIQLWIVDHGWLNRTWFNQGWANRATPVPPALFAVALAALAEAAADTVSSEIGQVLGGRPRMITTFREAEPGSDGAISVAGSIAGILAGVAIAGVGTWALNGDWRMFALSSAGAVFGLFFDSLLGATLENLGWLNNDAVNFLSTAAAASFAVVGLLVLR
jgi:uncharacterized protein (TIGR00297 family)